MEIPWHAQPADEVAQRLGVDPAVGLGDEEAATRLEQVGPNRLEARQATPAWRIFLGQFTNALIGILAVAAVVSAAVGEVADAVAILAILLVNGILGFFQEWNAERSLQALRRMLAPTCRVRRGGGERELDAEALVPGDVVILETGDRIPADLRLIETADLEVDESMLTGESLPVGKSPAPVATDTPLPQATPMAWMGATVTSGRGVGLVVRTGMATAFGDIAHLTQTVEAGATPLQRRLSGLGVQMGLIALAVAALVVVVGWTSGLPPLEMFFAGVALAVAVVPEGLPAVVTVTLALGVRAMQKRNALVRSLRAVETLGSATVVCSDKTGTLTKNEMTVQAVALPDREIQVSGLGYEPRGGFRSEGAPLAASDPALQRFLRAALLASTAEIAEQEGIWRALGDPTEAALVAAARKGGLARGGEPLLHEVPFSSSRQRMLRVVATDAGPIAYAKGAPEVILPRCARMLRGGRAQPLGDAEREAIEAAVASLSTRGFRTLAVAERRLEAPPAPDAGDELEEGLTWLGIAGILDPPREGVDEAVAEAERAGVRTVMITGDAPGTALSIARRIGIAATEAVTGSELDRFDDRELREALRRPILFARTLPEQKLRIVRTLQELGEVVAVTGDGVNDAPALERANIGVAMGIRGTDVAKSAADIVLLDDDYGTLIHAMEEGRRQTDNIRKFVRFLLSSNAAEVFAILGALAIDGRLILLPVQLLWINLVTDGLIAVSLGREPAERDVMGRPPIPPQAKLVGWSTLALIAGFGLWMAATTLWLYFHGLAAGGVERASTLAFTGLVLAELAYVLNFRSSHLPLRGAAWWSNPLFVWAWLATIALQVAAVHLPPLQRMLHTTPLPWTDWLLLAGVASPLFLLPEAAKWIRWRRALSSPPGGW